MRVLPRGAARACPDARLVVIGDGPDRARARRACGASAASRDAVEFLGFLPRGREGAAAAARRGCVVQPSPKEGWGLTVVEAGACGTAVVAADSPGLRDSVRRDETGLLVPLRRRRRAGRRAGARAHDAPLRERLAAAGVAWAARFTWPDCAARSLDALLGGAAAGAERRTDDAAPRRAGRVLLAAKIALSVGADGVPVPPHAARRVSPRRCARARSELARRPPFGLLVASNVLGAFQWERLLRAVGHPHPVLEGVRLLPRRPVLQQFPARQHRRRHRARARTPRATGPTATAALSTVLMDRLIGTVALAGLALVTTLPAIDRFHLALVYLALVGVLRAQRDAAVGGVPSARCCPRSSALLARIGLGALEPASRRPRRAPRGIPRATRGCCSGCSPSRSSCRSSRIGVHVLVARALGLDIAVDLLPAFRAAARGDSLAAHFVEWHRGARGSGHRPVRPGRSAIARRRSRSSSRRIWWRSR